MRKVRLAGTVSLAVAAALLLSTCGTSPDEVTSLAPTAIAVKRYTTAGVLDASFGGNTGAVFTKIDPAAFEYALAVALQSDGKILAAGHSVLAGQSVIALVRYETDGSPDTGFGVDGIVRTTVGTVDAVGTAIAMQGTQILVAGSTFNPATARTGIVLARYDADGALDLGFGGAGLGFTSAEIGPGTNMDVVSLALQGTNMIVAGATSDGNFVLRRYDSAGVLDATFGTNGTVTTSVGTSAMGPAIALQPPDDKILAAGASGSFATPPMNAVLVRYNANGTIDTSFGPTPNGFVFTDIGPSNNFSNAVVVQPDNKIVVAGHAFVNFATDTSDISLLRYNPDGTLDAGFGAGGVVVTDLGAFDNVFSVALQSTGEILVSGNTGSGGFPRVALLRYTPAGLLDPTFAGGAVDTSATGPSIVASGNAVALQSDGSIVVAGYD